MIFIGVLCKIKKYIIFIYLFNFIFVSKMGKSKWDLVFKLKKKNENLCNKNCIFIVWLLF